MARFTPRTTEREMRSAWWDIKESEYLGDVCVVCVRVCHTHTQTLLKREGPQGGWRLLVLLKSKRTREEIAISLASPQGPPSSRPRRTHRRGLSRLRDRPQLRLRADKLPSPNHCERRDFLFVNFHQGCCERRSFVSRRKLEKKSGGVRYIKRVMLLGGEPTQLAEDAAHTPPADIGPLYSHPLASPL